MQKIVRAGMRSASEHMPIAFLSVLAGRLPRDFTAKARAQILQISLSMGWPNAYRSSSDEASLLLSRSS